MIDRYYNVVFRGATDPEKDRNTIIKHFRKKTGVSEEQAIAIFASRRPIAIKKGLSQERALNLANKLAVLGMRVQAVESDDMIRRTGLEGIMESHEANLASQETVMLDHAIRSAETDDLENMETRVIDHSMPPPAVDEVTGHSESLLQSSVLEDDSVRSETKGLFGRLSRRMKVLGGSS